jgi:hypothetical protein
LALSEGWITEALNVIQLAIPSPNNPYRARINGSRGGGAVQRVAVIAQMLRALLPDIDAGLLGNLGNKIRAETFDEFLDHAETYLQAGRKMEASVIAGVVFEDTIRRIYRDKVTNDKGRQLEDVINALAKQDIGAPGRGPLDQSSEPAVVKGDPRSLFHRIGAIGWSTRRLERPKAPVGAQDQVRLDSIPYRTITPVAWTGKSPAMSGSLQLAARVGQDAGG